MRGEFFFIPFLFFLLIVEILYEEVIDKMTTVIKRDTVLELDVDKEDINSLHKMIASEIAFYEEELENLKKMKGVLLVGTMHPIIKGSIISLTIFTPS